MSIMKVIFLSAIYAAVGGLLCGLLDDEDNLGWYISIWPLFVVIAFIVIIAELPRRIGKEFHDRWESK